MTVVPETKPEQQNLQETVKPPPPQENDDKLQEKNETQQQSSSNNSLTSLNIEVEKMDGGAIIETQHVDPDDNHLQINDKKSLSHSLVLNNFTKPNVQLYSSNRDPIQSQNE